jgi:phage shock protein A
VHGLAVSWIGRREHRHPDAVYEAAIQERLEQYVKLRSAAAGVLYMRSKLAKQLELASAELGRVGRQLDIAVDKDDDAIALALIHRRDGLDADVARLTSELEELTTEADAAKKNLVAFQSEIARLREEKVRMLARLANAKARLRFQETLAGLSPDADIRALEEVRDHINRLVAETQVSRDLGDSEPSAGRPHPRGGGGDGGARAARGAMRTRREKPSRSSCRTRCPCLPAERPHGVGGQVAGGGVFRAATKRS